MINGKQPLPDNAFTSSSNYGDSFKPQFAKLNSKPNDVSGNLKKKNNFIGYYKIINVYIVIFFIRRKLVTEKQ